MTTVEISSSSGRVTVIAEARQDVAVDGGTRREDGPLTRVEVRSGPVEVRCPFGTDLRVGSSSGRVQGVGALGDVRVTTASGRVEFGPVRAADVRSSSGSVVIESCDEDCRIVASSGRVQVGRARFVSASTRSGRVELGPVDTAEVRVASGNVEVAATGEGDLMVATRSGSVLVTVPPGVHPHLDVVSNQRLRADVSEGEDFRLTVRANSGRVTVSEASGGP